MWAPPASNASAASPPPLRPVIVFIHGGGYLTGSVCDTPELKGQWLAALKTVDGAGDGAVLILPQYRLGVMGFLGGDALRTSPGSGSGNYGVLDTRLALEWVRANAASFGGDADRVLLAGQSAGAGIVGAHTVMQRSFGLFHSASLESGAYGAWTAQTWNTTEQTLRDIVNRTGCGSQNTRQSVAPPDATNLHGGHEEGRNVTVSNAAIQCLSKLPAAALLSAANSSDVASFSPSPDGVELLGLPWVLAGKGHVVKGVPVIVGSTAEDSDANLTVSQYNLTTTKEDFLALVDEEMPWANRSTRELMVAMYEHDRGTPPLPGRLDPMAHPGGGDVADGGGASRLNASYSKWYWAAKHMLADAEMFCPNRRAARWITAANRNASRGSGGGGGGWAWHYLWGHIPLVVGGPGNGAAHNDDTMFWLHIEHSPNATCQLNSPAERALSLDMARWWISLAATGDPNRVRASPAPPVWPAYPVDDRGGADAAVPLMVLRADGDLPKSAGGVGRGGGGGGGSYVALGAREKNCEFWDAIDWELTPVD